MEPKFQSSFIPRGPISTSANSLSMPVRRSERSFFFLFSSGLFILSLIFAVGVFGYKYFLNYRITQMKSELEEARAALEPETVNELIKLNDRLLSTESLIKRHKVILPLFDFFQSATPKTVRYTNLNFNSTPQGIIINLEGQARSYAALSVAADVLNKAENYLQDPVFSNLMLDDKGNVLFTARAVVVPEILSYDRFVSQMPKPTSTPLTTASSTPSTATSTSNTR